MFVRIPLKLDRGGELGGGRFFLNSFKNLIERKIAALIFFKGLVNKRGYFKSG